MFPGAFTPHSAASVGYKSNWLTGDFAISPFAAPGAMGDTEVTDLADIGKSEFPLQMKIEDNSWRPEDDVASGLDGWLGVSPSWVRIDNPEDIAAGTKTPITGEFQIYLEGLAAASKVLVRGTFTIDNVREDVWGYHGPDGATTFEEVKETENDTPVCGEERLTTDE